MRFLRQDKTSLIFQAAIDIFSERGFDRATMDDIAARANVAKGTIYYHFKSKEDLFLFLVEEGIDLLREAVHEQIRPDMTGKQKLEAAIRQQIEFFGEYRDFCIIMLREAWGAEQRQKEFRKMLTEYTKLLEGLIAQGIAEGSFIKTDPESAAWTVFGGAAIASLHLLLGRREYRADQLSRQVTAILLEGLQAD
ncbi:TetR/AcrR family transcriptional regulator [Effusibacillus pohliae]|uniref:TetR/AcrR family transcriptional regulator n=1 Tax=Effusibacillus pohliae TaxID=232270 RepID=UPI00039DBA2F|nr:TetR/AcrR family transcriptional regulator [Effusibacillus pohliae]